MWSCGQVIAAVKAVRLLWRWSERVRMLLMRHMLALSLFAATLLAACESVGIGVGIGVPIGRGGVSIGVGGSVPLPQSKPAEPASSAPQ
jgi:hypothetical protein